MPGQHSKRGPSAAHRWRPCPGSVEAERDLPDDAGEEAIQGTVFHEYAADCVELGLMPHSLVGARMMCEDGAYREFTKTMAEKMMPGLIMLWAMADSPGAVLLVEQRLDLQYWVGEGEFGTSDACVIDLQRRKIVVFDWKWGIGVPVSPEWNDQAILYFLGCWTTFAHGIFEQDLLDNGGNPNDPWEDDIEVEVIIEQPRAPGGGGVWHTTVGELLAEGERVRRDAKATEDPNAPRVPGIKQCQFCKAGRANACLEKIEFMSEMVGIDLDELEEDLMLGLEPTLPDLSALTPEQRTQIVLHAPMIKDWLDRLHDEAMEANKKDRGSTPGLKRVPGRNSPRGWVDPAKAEKVLEAKLKDRAFKKKLLSPAQAEEELGREEYEATIQPFVRHGTPKPILVKESDPREALMDDDELIDLAWDGPVDESDDSLI